MLLVVALQGEVINQRGGAGRQSGNRQWKASKPRRLLQRENQRSDAQPDAEDRQNQPRREEEITTIGDPYRHNRGGASSRHQRGNG